jgi:hypothetical protein
METATNYGFLHMGGISPYGKKIRERIRTSTDNNFKVQHTIRFGRTKGTTLEHIVDMPSKTVCCVASKDLYLLITYSNREAVQYVINNFDPLHFLAMGGPDDGYLTEVDDICQRIDDTYAVLNVDQIKEIVVTVFNQKFDLVNISDEFGTEIAEIIEDTFCFEIGG